MLTDLTTISLLHLVLLYGASVLILSFFILGLFLAANHTFVENGEIKGLILVDFRESLEAMYKKVDGIQFFRALRNLSSLLLGLSGVMFAIVKILQTGDYNYSALFTSVVFFVLFNKSYYDIGVMVLGCFRCMSTFWIALPMMIGGLYLGFTVSTVYFWMLPGGVFTTSVVSGLVSFIYMTYDKCKLEIEEAKRDREIANMRATMKKEVDTLIARDKF